MKFLKLFQKKVNKTLNKGIIAYTNNTRILKNKKKQLTKKIMPEFKELVYDFLLHWESSKSEQTIKFFILFFLTYLTIENVYPFMKGFHQKWLVGHQIIQDMNRYQTDNLHKNKQDTLNENKIITSYWTNYL
jgi:hypothetical protein